MPTRDRSGVRILVDGAIVKPQLGGIASYVVGMVSGLAVQDGVSVCIATSVPELFDFPGVDVIELPATVRVPAARVAWRECSLRRLAKTSGADVLFTPTIELPLLRRPPLPVIAVVHDIGPIVAPAIYGGQRRQLRYVIAVRLACRRAGHVVCVSAATLEALRARLAPISAPCSVVGEAGQLMPVLARNARLPPFVLSVGAALPHKNLETLVAAMNADALLDVGLELAGPLDERERTQFDAWRARVRRPERIVHHGFVEPLRLAELYASASLVAIPSRYEGFGLPMLEAMRAGVPVVASALPALRELGAGGAEYVSDPLSVTEWSVMLHEIIASRSRTAEMAREGARRAARFAWPDIAAQTAAIAADLARGTGGREQRTALGSDGS